MKSHSNKSTLLTTFDASALTGLSADYIRKLVRNGFIKAKKLGNMWLIDKKMLKKIKRQRSKSDGSD